MAITLDGNNTLTVGVPNSGTAQASTSGTSIDFTGIPAGVKRITVMLYNVSTNGANDLIVQVGNGSIVTTGYLTQRTYVAATAANANASYTNCIASLPTNTAADTKMAQIIITNVTGNTWIASCISSTINTVSGYSNGGIALGSALDRVRVTSTTGSDTFDAGSINILYE